MATLVSELAQSDNPELSGLVRRLAGSGGLVGRLTDCAARFPRFPGVQAAVFAALDNVIRVLQVPEAYEEAEAYGAQASPARLEPRRIVLILSPLRLRDPGGAAPPLPSPHFSPHRHPEGHDCGGGTVRGYQAQGQRPRHPQFR